VVNRLGNIAHPPRAGEIALFAGWGCTKMLRFRAVDSTIGREGEGEGEAEGRREGACGRRRLTPGPEGEQGGDTEGGDEKDGRSWNRGEGGGRGRRVVGGKHTCIWDA
jgi:hypothetical protein